MTPDRIKESSSRASEKQPQTHHLFYAMKQRLHLLLKNYLKQITKNSRQTESINNYSKVIETIVVRISEMEGIQSPVIQLMLLLFSVTILCENVNVLQESN